MAVQQIDPQWLAQITGQIAPNYQPQAIGSGQRAPTTPGSYSVNNQLAQGSDPYANAGLNLNPYKGASAQYNPNSGVAATAAGAQSAAAPDPYAQYQQFVQSLTGQLNSYKPDYSQANQYLSQAQQNIRAPQSNLGNLLNLMGPSPQVPNYDPAQYGKTQAQLEYGGQIQGLSDALQSLNQNFGQQEAAQQQYGQQGANTLQGVFNALQQSLGNTAGQIGGAYDQAAQAQNAAYGQAGQSIQGVNKQVMDALQNLAGGLGIQQGLGAGGAFNPVAQLESTYQQQAGQNALNQASTAGSTQANKANSMDFALNQLMGAGRQGAQAQTQLQLGVQQALADLGLQQAQGQQGINQQQAILRQQQPLAEQLYTQQAAGNLYNMQRQAAADRLAEITGLGGLDIGEQNIQLGSNKQTQDLLLGLAQNATQQQTGMSQYGLQGLNMQAQLGNPLTVSQALANLQRTGAQTDLAQARTGNILNPQAKPTAGTTFADRMQTTLGNGGLQMGDPGYNTAIAFVNAADQQKALGVASDPYQWALNQLNSNQKSLGLSQADLNTVKAALQSYYKGT
jgi:hypothetical protein